MLMLTIRKCHLLTCTVRERAEQNMKYKVCGYACKVRKYLMLASMVGNKCRRFELINIKLINNLTDNKIITRVVSPNLATLTLHMQWKWGHIASLSFGYFALTTAYLVQLVASPSCSLSFHLFPPLLCVCSITSKRTLSLTIPHHHHHHHPNFRNFRLWLAWNRFLCSSIQHGKYSMFTFTPQYGKVLFIQSLSNSVCTWALKK